MKVNSTLTKISRFAQRVDDIQWIMDQSKSIYDNFMACFIEGNASWSNQSETQKIKMLQFRNIQTEFAKLKGKFEEIDYSDLQQLAKHAGNQPNLPSNAASTIIAPEINSRRNRNQSISGFCPNSISKNIKQQEMATRRNITPTPNQQRQSQIPYPQQSQVLANEEPLQLSVNKRFTGKGDNCFEDIKNQISLIENDQITLQD